MRRRQGREKEACIDAGGQYEAKCGDGEACSERR